MSTSLPYGDPFATGYAGYSAPPIRGERTIPFRKRTDTVSHESYLLAIRDIGLARLTDPSMISALRKVRLVYGVGNGTAYGVCYSAAWHADGNTHDVIEICASNEVDKAQLADTVLHEYGHSLARLSTGANQAHNKVWVAACHTLGLANPKQVAAAGVHTAEHFDPEIWALIDALPVPNDGKPGFHLAGQGLMPLIEGWHPLLPRKCGMGRGTKGGPMHQTNKQKLYHCGCTPPIKARSASPTFAAHCDHCSSPFTPAPAGKRTGRPKKNGNVN